MNRLQKIAESTLEAIEAGFYKVGYRCYDESDSTPCWDDIIKAVFEAGIEEAAWRSQGPR